jgi:hypothetical protein
MFSRTAMHFGFRTLCALFAVLIVAGAASAAELVMVRRDGCPWCAQWDREIGPIYPKTEIGRRLPLRMLDLNSSGMASIKTRSPIHYTPTFVLVEKGAEIGRIEGYPGDAFFWGLLERLVEQLPPPKGAAAPAAAVAALERGR